MIVPHCPRCGDDTDVELHRDGPPGGQLWWCPRDRDEFDGSVSEWDRFADERIARRTAADADALIDELDDDARSDLLSRAQALVEPVLDGRRPKPLVDAAMRRLVLEERRS